MTELSKINVPIFTVAALIVSACSFLGSYFAFREALKDTISDLRLQTTVEIAVLKNNDQRQDKEIAEQNNQIAKLNDAVKAATTYIGAGMRPQ
jgi:hypothetical protein